MAELSTAARNRLASSEFVFPEKRGYPIEDRAHARAALQAAGGARSGKPLPPAKAAKVRAAVHRKFPSLGKPKASSGHNWREREE